MTDPFDAIGGHTASIFHGADTTDGRRTLQKVTTAWEIIYYLAMTHPAEIRECLHSYSPLHDADRFSLAEFVDAARGLRRFVSECFSVRLPAAWEPEMPPLALAVAALGGAATLCDRWLQLQDERLTDLWAPLWIELFIGSLPLTAFRDLYDKPIWGVGLVDATCRMAEPAVMDVKVGFYRHSPFTAAAKVERMNRKEAHTITRECALRVSGLRRFDHSTVPHGVERQGRAAGYAFTTVSAMAAGTRAFFSTSDRLFVEGDTAGGNGKKGLQVAPRPPAAMDAAAHQRLSTVATRVGQLVRFFEETAHGRYLLTNMAFVSTSLLFFYDAADASGNCANALLIDLARSGPRRLNFDEEMLGFLQGLKNCHSFLTREDTVTTL